MSDCLTYTSIVLNYTGPRETRGKEEEREGEEREGGGGRENKLAVHVHCALMRERETAQPKHLTKLTSINITVGNLEKSKFGKLQISFIGWLIIGPVSLSMCTVNKMADLILVNGKEISKFTN